MPVGSPHGKQILTVADRLLDGTLHTEQVMNVLYVPLTDRSLQE